MDTKKFVGLIGSIVLFIGVFAPTFSSVMDGNISYFHSGQGEGIIVLILAGISLLLVLTGKFQGLWFTGLGSLAIMLFTFFDFQGWFSQTDTESELADNPFLGLIYATQLEWGWAVLILGVAFVITPASMKDDTYPSPHWPLRPVALLDLMNNMERIVTYLEKVPMLGGDRCDDIQRFIDRLQKRIDQEDPSV